MTTGAALPLDELRETIAAADAVLPTGARTRWEVGNPPGEGVEVRAPAGEIGRASCRERV